MLLDAIATTSPEFIFILLAVGLAGGFLSGLLGIGGGVVFVPALLYIFNLMGVDPSHAMHVAVATSLAIIVLTSSSSSYAHYKHGAVDFDILKRWIPFIIGGVIIGTVLASFVEGAVLKKVFSIVVIVLAIYMALSKSAPLIQQKENMPRWLQKLLSGCIGAVAAMAGLGGGALFVPMMAFNSVQMKRAVGTGAVMGLVIAVPATFSYMIGGYIQDVQNLPPLSVGFVHLPAALSVAVTSVFAARQGACIAHKLPRLVLRRIFAGLLIIVSIRMLLSV